MLFSSRTLLATAAIAASLTTTLAAPFDGATAADALEARLELAGLRVIFYSKGDCTGDARPQRVNIGSCATPKPGFSSVRIVEKLANGFGGPNVVTVFTKGDCGCPTCGSHGFDTTPGQCLKFPEFVGNAISVR